MQILNITNPEELIYANDIVTLTVLGGLRIEGLDRMRVTLKAELSDSPRPPVRHNLDLYNDTQTEKFIRKVAERLEIGTSVVAASVAELTEQLESYRLEKIKEQQPDELRAKVLSEEEIKEADAYLKGADLIERTMQDLQQTGIVGEAVNSMILYIAMTSSRCADPVSVISLAKSGMGKSYLQEKVAACMPEELLIENTQLTENSFYYFKREEIRGKVFLIEDLDGAQSVLYPIRELQSKKRISKTVTAKDKNGQMRTVTLVVEGPVSVIGCTTKEQIYEDNANRSILIYLDNSKEQDQSIQDYQRAAAAGIVEKHREVEKRQVLRNVQRRLEPVKVVNPYAVFIRLPREDFKPRRTMGLLLSFIEAITFYCQKQRAQKVDESTGEIFIETTPEDIEWAFKLLKETLFRKSDELSGACRSFYEYLKTWVGDRQTTREDPEEQAMPVCFYASEIRRTNRMNPRTLQRYLKELVEYNYLQITGGNKHKTGYQYGLCDQAPQEHLQQSIDTQLAEIMQQIKAASTEVSKTTVRNKRGSKEKKNEKDGLAIS